MADDDGTRRWQRPARADTVSDALQLLRMSIVEIREAPGDPEARRRPRARILEDSCDDRPAAIAVLDELLAASPDHLPALERVTALAACARGSGSLAASAVTRSSAGR